MADRDRIQCCDRPIRILAISPDTGAPAQALQGESTDTCCILRARISHPLPNQDAPLLKNQPPPMVSGFARMHPCPTVPPPGSPVHPAGRIGRTFATPGKGARASLVMRPPHSKVDHGSPLLAGIAFFPYRENDKESNLFRFRANPG